MPAFAKFGNSSNIFFTLSLIPSIKFSVEGNILDMVFNIASGIAIIVFTIEEPTDINPFLRSSVSRLATPLIISEIPLNNFETISKPFATMFIPNTIFAASIEPITSNVLTNPDTSLLPNISFNVFRMVLKAGIKFFVIAEIIGVRNPFANGIKILKVPTITFLTTSTIGNNLSNPFTSCSPKGANANNNSVPTALNLFARLSNELCISCCLANLSVSLLSCSSVISPTAMPASTNAFAAANASLSK